MNAHAIKTERSKNIPIWCFNKISKDGKRLAVIEGDKNLYFEVKDGEVLT